MGEKIDAPLPLEVAVGDGWQIIIDAVDPTTGANVSGVVVSNVSVVAASYGATLADFPNPILVAATEV